MEEIRDWIYETMQAAGYSEEEFQGIAMLAYGSRVNGHADDNSDLDILFEYEGTAREDDVFNTLHINAMKVQGILVDVNPIKAECSGTIEEYLQRCDDNWKKAVKSVARKR